MFRVGKMYTNVTYLDTWDHPMFEYRIRREEWEPRECLFLVLEKDRMKACVLILVGNKKTWIHYEDYYPDQFEEVDEETISWGRSLEDRAV